ncbi:MAG: outer membrane beta-barrel protein [Pseudobdellovibrionaceae bacterium]
MFKLYSQWKNHCTQVLRSHIVVFLLAVLSLFFLSTLTTGNLAYAEESRSQWEELKQSPLLAQLDADEAFDPFADYSEFDEASDEEADINFFRNGRFFTVGLATGFRGFTGNFKTTYGSGPTFGLFLAYFFDLKFAFQLGFMTGDHSVKFASTQNSYTGTVSFTTLNFDLKYYMNTQNVTKGLADLNPYIIGGFAQFYRTYTISNIEGFARDTTMGVDLGAGIEIPIMRKKGFLGLQGTYRYVNFPDENKDFVQGQERLENKIDGDLYDILLILGMNF